MTEIDGRHGLVLQGGGALGAFELGVARAVYSPGCAFRPGVISGVSIGAITATLLGRPARGLTPLQALEAFWAKVTVSGLFPASLQPYASAVGLPHFFRLNPFWPWGTNIYSTAPLRDTLAGLVDVEALADPAARPLLCVTATDIEAGQIVPFLSRDGGLTLDHILASGSLPPSFPATKIGDRHFWDGGVFDNTPLGDVIDGLAPGDDDRAVMVVNLFSNRMKLPTNMSEVGQHFLNLLFVNKTASDLKLMDRFNAVADVSADLAALPADSPVRQLPSVQRLIGKKYRRVPKILAVTRTSAGTSNEASDFSAAGISRRADEGQALTLAALRAHGFDVPAFD